MPNPILGLFVYVFAGFYAVWWGRKAFFYPNEILKRWYSYVPLKSWSRKLLRAFSVFWVFGGILIMLQGVSPFLQKIHRFGLVLASVSIAAAGTVVLLRRGRKIQAIGPPESR